MRARPILFGLLVLFAVYAIIVAPEQSAAFVRQVFNLVVAAFASLFTFFNALISG